MTDEEQILNVLMSQQFADWYASPGEPSGRFEAFITAEENAPTREEVLADIREMFSKVWRNSVQDMHGVNALYQDNEGLLAKPFGETPVLDVLRVRQLRENNAAIGNITAKYI